MRKKYQSKERKSNHKFEIVRGQELQMRVPLPMAEVWAEMQARVEELTGQAGRQILRAILENEVIQRVGPPHRPNPTAGCVRWGKQPGYVVFAGQKVPLERPRVRTRDGREVELETYGQLQKDGKLQRAVREGVVAGLSTRNYRRAVESVLEGYGIEKSSVSRQFVAASSNQLRELCERRLEDLNLVVLMIDGIHFGGQVLVVALEIAEGGEKHVLGVWQGATENTTVVKGLLEDLVDRGLDSQRRYLVVIDGSKALRAGVESVFGAQAEVQRMSFLSEGPSRLLETVHWRKGGAYESRTIDLGDRSYGAKKPVFVLTSHSTFSAGEALAYDIQSFKRGLVVGETTGGGANPGGMMPLGHGFFAKVPNGYIVNAATGTNWEGVGVKPDVEVPADQAFAKARSLVWIASAPVPPIRRRGLFSKPWPRLSSTVRQLSSTLSSWAPTARNLERLQ